jgi:hypothetical protein
MIAGRGRITGKNVPAYAKIRRVLNCAYFCVQMEKVNQDIRLYGTSCIQYDPIFKSKLYIKRGLAKNSTNEEQFDMPKYMFHPEHKLSIAWTMFGLILLIYIITFMPYGMLYYDSSMQVFYFELIMNFYFILDIFVIFNMAMYDSNSTA